MLPNESFLNKLVVDKTIKPLIEEKVLWENMGIPKMSIQGLTKQYYKETYMDFETPNDSALGRTMDPKKKAPAVRFEGGEFPHVEISQPSKYVCTLYQMGFETDYSEEEMKYADLINQVQRKTQKLANFFVSHCNMMVGNALTENWTSSPSSIQSVTISANLGWTASYTASDPIKNLLDAQEKIEEVSGYNYRANQALVSRQSFYDLKYWMAKMNLNYSNTVPTGAIENISVMGINVMPTNQVKQDFAVMADFGRVGEIYEAEAMNTRKYYTPENRMYHLQMSRTWNFVMTDPKAACVIINTA